MSYQLKPEKIIRELDLEKIFIGKEITVKLANFVKEKNILNPASQRVIVDIIIGEKGEGEYGKDWINLCFSDYTKLREVISKDYDGKEFKWKVANAYFVIAKNGGRIYREDRPKTYSEFFNEEQKERYKGQLKGGVMGRVLVDGAGDMDRADIIIEFENGVKIDDNCWEVTAPEEWYSEIYKDDSRFKFVDGFYPSAEKAIDVFSQKSQDDIFGTRYFPVLVFDKNVSEEIISEAMWRPKASSTPIIQNGHIIIGTRCKPDEFQEVIEHCYKNGGKIPVGVEWNW